MTFAHKTTLDILVPRLADANNQNAQNQNARALLARFKNPGVTWHVLNYGDPDQSLVARDNINCMRLWKGRLWRLHAVLKYLGEYDAIFYPGNEAFDVWGLRLRRLLGRSIPVISTIEGIPGNSERESRLSIAAGHRVYCFLPRSGSRSTHSYDDVRGLSDLSIAITPFMASMGRELYPVKQVHMPIGVDTRVFHARNRDYPSVPTILGVGTLYQRKRPEVFLELARRIPGARFVWLGDGPMYNSLQTQAANLPNLDFPGEMNPSQLAEKLREATAFVLPSRSEGLPKVTQEAAACGLPVVVFGNYETPSVVDGLNGMVVWEDEELFSAVEKLVESPDLVLKMGSSGAKMAAEWSWDLLAPRWEDAVLSSIDKW
jgi:glycosyltransferase involved in cell wall biosynthesis